MAMNTRKTASIIFFLMLILASVVGSAFAQTSVSVGVSQGDSFKYDLKYLWSSTNLADVVPSSWASMNQTDYFQINVDVAADTSLRLSTVWRFVNGTEAPPGVEIQEVGSNNATGFIYIYAANLNAGSHLFPLATDLPFIINNTMFRTYTNNEFRATNHIEVNRTDLSNRVYSYMDLYFDKNTGVLVEATLKEVYSDQPRQTYTTEITLKESSLWNISPTPTTSAAASPSMTTTSPQSTTSPATTQDGETPTAESFDMLLIVLVVIFVVIIISIIFTLLTRRPKTTRKSSAPSTAPEIKTETAVTIPITPGMIKCSNCGYENPEANEFCGKCGKRVRK